MIIYLPFENYHRDFLGRLILAKELLKNKEVNSVHIGWHKEIFWHLFSTYFLSRKSDQSILIDSNSFNYKYPFIKLLNLAPFKYYVLDEEEIGLTFQKKKLVKFRSSNYKFSNLIHKKFVFNEKLKKIYSEFLPKKKIVVSGNPKIQLYQNIKKIKFIKKKTILVMMPMSYFRFKIFLDYKFNKYRPDRNKKKLKIKLSYLERFIKNIDLMIKENPNKKFIVRPHPADIEYYHYYKKLFTNSKNVIIKHKGFAFEEIISSDKLICGLDFSPIEGVLLNKKPKVFLGNIMNEDKTYRNHFANKIKGIEYFRNRINLDSSVKHKIKLRSVLSKNFLTDKDSSKIIADSIEYKFKKKNLMDKLFWNISIFILSKPVKLLQQIKKKLYDRITIRDYKDYCNLIERSFVLKFINKFYSNIFYSLYKIFLFYKFDDHTAYRMSGQQQKLELNNFKKIINFINKDKWFSYNINKSQTCIVLKKNFRKKSEKKY